MTKPKLLDLFCGVGGASVGYHRAGFEVTGVDVEPQPNYPFKFVLANALEMDLTGYDAVHASPPCQGYSMLNKFWANTSTHPRLIPQVRRMLTASGLPFVIENVVSAPLVNPIKLCGSMFRGLRVVRHRLFETNFAVPNLRCGRHEKVFRYGKGLNPNECWFGLYGRELNNVGLAKLAMDMPWAKTLREVTEAIPPRYTHYIGLRLMWAVTGGPPPRRDDMLAQVNLP